MPSLWDSILHMFTSTVAQSKAILSEDTPKPPPMNVSEVTDIWRYLALIESMAVIVHVGKNTSFDLELLQLIEETETLARSQSDRIRELMEEEGIPQPAVPADKPRSEPGAVPLGVKMADAEIAGMIAAHIVAGMLACCSHMAECVRTDLEVMWGHFLFEQVTMGAKWKSTMKMRGWLKVPPAYHPPGLPVQ